MELPIYLLVLLVFGFYVWKATRSLVSGYRRSVSILGDFPGLRLFIHPHSIFAMALPRIRGFNIGDQYPIRYAHSLFTTRTPHDILSVVAFFPPCRAFILADPVAIKAVVSDRYTFQKNPLLYAGLTVFGENLVAAEGDVWRRHRKIVAGSFSEKMNAAVWRESALSVAEAIHEWETSTGHRNKSGKLEVEVESMVELTLKLSLFVICGSAFSYRPPWLDEAPYSIPTGHSIPFRIAMAGVLENALVKVITPNWAYKLPIPRLHHVAICYEEFGAYLRETIAERRASAADLRESEDGTWDVLGALVYASAGMDDENDEDMKKDQGVKEVKKGSLTEREVMGNMFALIGAGHETTAHTLAFALTLLALYQDEQDKLFAHIDEILPVGTEADFSHFSKLTLVTATFMESIRLYPSGVAIPKITMADTTIPVAPLKEGDPPSALFVPKYTDILIDAVALHRNRTSPLASNDDIIANLLAYFLVAKYWGEDCNIFKPERFVDAPDGSYRWPRDSFMGFSGGARNCIGYKFGTVEGVATLTHLLRKYSVHLPEDLNGEGEKRKLAGETFAEKVERVIKCRSVIVLTPAKLALIFKER